MEARELAQDLVPYQPAEVDEDDLALDIALHQAAQAEAPDLMRIAKKHGLSIDGLRARIVDPSFQELVEVQRTTMNYDAHVHRMRCAALAPKVLEDVIVPLARSETTPAATKLKAAEMIMRDAGLQPKEAAPEVGTNVTIQIDLSSLGEEKIVTVGGSGDG